MSKVIPTITNAMENQLVNTVPNYVDREQLPLETRFIQSQYNSEVATATGFH